MKRTIPLLARMAPLGLLVLALLAGASPGPPEPSAGADPEKSPYADKAEKPWASTADHSKFKILQQDFPDGPSVTKACLTCHTEAARQIMKTSHWTWICPKARKEMGVNGIKHQVPYGKAEYIINNFCIALPSNEPRCTSCHAGYGWADKTFDFKNQYLVDCLVCHDQTGKYKKFPTGAGHPVYKKDFPKGREWPPKSGKMWPPVDLGACARSVGKPTRRNCGSCHFFGGGGEGVKHGDMDLTLYKPHRTLDVHMNEKGVNFQCQKCHTTKDHKIAGRCFEIPAYNERDFVIRGLEANLLACESCHGKAPHEESKLNDHTDKVACQACHIPTLAREHPTKMWWDWSKAGKPMNGKKVIEGEVKGKKVHVFHIKKGEFIWAMDEPPEYLWYNGTMQFTLMGDKVDDTKSAEEVCVYGHGKFDKLDPTKPMVRINWCDTGYDDPKARIYPVKIHRGKQPYDPVNKSLVVPKLFPCGPDKKAAFWKSFDWSKAIEAGMKYVGAPYSGKYEFIQTCMIWPLDHMVAPKEMALSCVECHSPGGRLKKLKGFYMPGRDKSSLVDGIGLILVLLALVGSLGHGFLRMIFRAKG